jgi:hypothetical protein
MARSERRVILTHDVNTMPAFAFDRIRRNQAMPGILVVSQQAALAAVIEDVLLTAECGEVGDYGAPASSAAHVT